MGPNHGGGHFPTSSSGVTPVAPIWWAPPVGEHAPAPCALMPPAPPWPRTSRLRTPSARTLAPTGTAPAPHPSAPSTPRPAPSRHPPRPMPCHAPHALVSLVRTSPRLCPLADPRCVSPPCTTPSRRLCTHRPTLAPTCRPDVRAPPSGTHVSTPNFPRCTAEAPCTIGLQQHGCMRGNVIRGSDTDGSERERASDACPLGTFY